MAKKTNFQLLIFLFLLNSTIEAQVTFSNNSTQAGINFTCWVYEMGGGCAFFDFNNDGWEDIYMTGGELQDVLYQNNGNGTFSDVSSSAGLGFTNGIPTFGVLTGDIDNDGYREIFITTMMQYPNILLKNNGNGTFSNITISAGLGLDSIMSYAATFGDYNQDGYLDLYVGNYIDSIGFIRDSLGNEIGYAHKCNPNSMYINNGNSTFTSIASLVGTDDSGCNLSTAFTDYDNDGDVDILNANDFGAWVSPNTLLRNDFPVNMFSDVSVAANMDAQIYGMGIAIGDYDQDLDLDYYITNIGRNVLHKNLGNGTFVDTTNAAGVENEYVVSGSTLTTGWGTAFVDVDHDSYLDLFVANGYIELIDITPNAVLDPDKLYLNNGDGTFNDISQSAGVQDSMVSRGFAYADFDKDGDNDFLVLPVTKINSTDTFPAVLYRNELSNSSSWLKVKLQGTYSNRDAFGSHITIYVGGQSWLHEVASCGSHVSQHSTVAHFGLGSHSIVDSIVINWPNGLVESYNSINANQEITIIEGVGLSTIAHQKDKLQLLAFPSPTSKKLTVETNTKHNGQLFLYNNLGQVLYSQSISRGHQSIQLDKDELNLSSGMYTLELTNGRQRQLTKVVFR